MSKRPRSSAIDSFGERSGTAIGNDNGVSARRVCSANNSPEIMRIFDAVQNHEKACIVDHIVQFCVSVNSAKCDNPLVADALGGAIEHFARLEAERNGFSATEINDLLYARSGCAFCD